MRVAKVPARFAAVVHGAIVVFGRGDQARVLRGVENVFAIVARMVQFAGQQLLFITGYAVNDALSESQLAPDMHVMGKPFGFDALAERMGDIIEDVTGTPGEGHSVAARV